MEYRTKKTVQEGIVASVDGFYDYQPGNGTRYLLYISKVPEPMEKKLGVAGGGFLVAYMGHRAEVVPSRPGYFLNWQDISQWFRCNKADAVVLAEVIGYISGIPATSSEDAAEEDEADKGRSARWAVSNMKPS